MSSDLTITGRPDAAIDAPALDLAARTLGQLVTEDPRRARVLEGLGLDYCCGGRRTLAEAAAERGLDVAAVTGALELPDRGPAPNWQAMGPAELSRDIVATHHAYLWAEMPRLSALMDKVLAAHGERHPRLAAVSGVLGELLTDLAMHLRKEEMILFPAVADLEGGGLQGQCFGTVRNPISQMLAEHDAAGDMLAQLRRLTDDYAPPADACGSYRALLAGLEELERDTHEHIHKENNVLFPAVVELEDRVTGA